MNDTVFNPTDKKLTLTTDENQVRLMLGEEQLSQCNVEGCDQWDDSKILAYFYLEARVNNGCILEPKYNESIYTLILNTLKAQTGQDDFLTADWDGVRYECVEHSTPQPVYSTFTTTDGYDLTVSYMTPGLAWQNAVIRHDEEVPSGEELYARLTGKGNQEWVSNGQVMHDGVLYSYDSAATAVFTMKNRLQITVEGGDVIYSDEDVRGNGLIEALVDLHRKFQLLMNYGEVEALSDEHRLLISSNVAVVLRDLFGMGEYLELVDGLSNSIRGNIDPEIQCLITHTYVGETGRIRIDYRFFTNNQQWAVEHSVSFGAGEEQPFVTDVFTRNADQIRFGLGLVSLEQPITALSDIPFDNRSYGEVTQPTSGEPVFMPVSNEQLLEEDPDSAEAGEPVLVTAVVAAGPRGGIGHGSDLLFRIKEDLQFFKQVTTDHVVIMGRKTFESIGKPLPNRQNIVVTRDPEYVLNLYTPENDQQYNNLHCVTSIEEAVRLGARLANTVYNNNELMVIGGAEIYQQCMPFTQRILMTSINGDDSHADVFFPLSGADIQAGWVASVINDTQEVILDDGVSTLTYERYELTRKQ